MIRELPISELFRLAPAAKEFYAASRFLGVFHLARFEQIWTSLIEGGNGVIFADEREGEIVGTIGGIVHRDIYGEGTIAEEFFWFVREEFRGSGILLYREFERWAKGKGAAQIQMVHLLDVMPHKVGDFYIRCGYVPVETRYTKELTA